MSGFIPMVSTTPPPIDDDDFGDFMDGSQVEHDDDFADFSSPANYDDFSFPSLNSPGDVSKPVNFCSEEESPVEAKDSVFGDENQGDISTDKEVEVILTKKKSSVVEKQEANDSSVEEIPACNGTADAELSNRVDKSSKESIKEGGDWMDFDTVSPPRACEIEDSNSPVINAPADKPTFEGSPEPEDEDFRQDSNSIPSEQFQASPSPIHDENGSVQPFAENATVDGYGHDVSVKISNDVSSGHSGKDSIDEDFEESQSSNLSGSKVDEQENEADLCATVNSIKSSDSEASFQNIEQLSEGADCGQLRTEKAGDSDSEFVGFDIEKSDAELNSIKDSDNHVISNSVSADFGESQATPSSDFADFESPEQKSSDTIPPKSEEDLENASEKDCATDAFGDFESSTPKASQNVEEFKTDFDAFQTSCESAEKEDEEFADFGSANIQSSMDSQDHTVQQERDENTPDSEFAAFENVTENDEGFADFSNVQPAQEADFGDFSAGNDDFADFSSGSASTWPAFSHTVTKKPSLKEKVANYCLKFSKKSSGADLENEEEHISHLEEHLNSSVLPTSKDVGSPSTASVESIRILCPGDVWDQLEDIDNAIALNFLWNGSGHNKHLLDSLGMFTQNILFSGAKQAYYIPTYYAAGLGLVDPNKGVLKPMSAAEKITAMSPTDKNNTAVKEDLHPDETHTEWKTIADDPNNGSMNVDRSWLQDGQSLSNHAGDGRTSGNDPVTLISSTMDLDFFDSLPSVGGGGKPEGSTDLIDPELLELTSAPTTEPPPPPKDSGSATLSKILASITSSNNAQSTTNVAPSTTQDNLKWEEEESKLSAEARSVLKKLPNLSYMKAKVLMFPINMSRVNIGDD